MSYVYRYVHPDNPWLYVGRTENIHNRIRNHNSAAYDNIDRQYSEMLNESAVYYIELSNKAQSIAVEAYLIDKYKPMLNKSLIYENSGTTIDMSLPKWIKIEALEQKFNDSSDDLRTQITSLKKEKKLLENECKELNNKLLAYKKKLFNLDPSVNVLCKFEEAYNRLLIEKENNERFNISEQEVNSIVNYDWEFIEEFF